MANTVKRKERSLVGADRGQALIVCGGETMAAATPLTPSLPRRPDAHLRHLLLPTTPFSFYFSSLFFPTIFQFFLFILIIYFFLLIIWQRPRHQVGSQRSHRPWCLSVGAWAPLAVGSLPRPLASFFRGNGEIPTWQIKRMLI